MNGFGTIGRATTALFTLGKDGKKREGDEETQVSGDTLSTDGIDLTVEPLPLSEAAMALSSSKEKNKPKVPLSFSVWDFGGTQTKKRTSLSWVTVRLSCCMPHRFSNKILLNAHLRSISEDARKEKLPNGVATEAVFVHHKISNHTPFWRPNTLPLCPHTQAKKSTILHTHFSFRSARSISSFFALIATRRTPASLIG